MDKIKEYITNQFREQVGYTPNIDNPKSFNEKIQWLKLYYRDSLLTKCADKYAVRDYVKEKIGEKYLIPLLGVYDNADQIDFDNLPNKFVLKVNNGSGKNILCTNKKILNTKQTKENLQEWIRPEKSHYFYSYEWSYKNIEPKIICEEYIEQSDGKLLDYKFLCFNGKPKYFWVDIDRFTQHKRNFYDLRWNLLDIEYVYPKEIKYSIPKPKQLENMVILAKKLSSGFPHVRIDLYEIKNQIYFGEMTFYPENGMGSFRPAEWDYKLGELLNLPNRIKPSLNNIQNLKNELILKEIKYGGIVTNVPRNKVSDLDPRTTEEIKTGGMTGGDRMLHHAYAEKYARYLVKFLERKKLIITEVGILTGTGLAIWSDLFPKANIYGFDIDLINYQKNQSNLKQLGAFKRNTPIVMEFDQFKENSELLNKLFNINKVDIFIDDGNHSNEANLNTFKQMLPFLSPNFVYFIEDNVAVYQKLKEKYPQYKVESFGELTIITNPKQEITDYLDYKKTRKAKVAIYTAYNENYDKLINHTHLSKDFDYICFTDKKIKNPGIWEVKLIKKTKLDAVRTSRYYKLFPHELLSKYKYSIWIDSNVDVTSDVLEKRVNELITKKIKIAIPPHFERNCIYQEAKACIDFQKDNPDIILKQVKFLKKEKYPKNIGLSENNIIFREHNDPQIIKVMEGWWSMINKYSRRDQLSLNYELWKNKIDCTPLFSQNARLMNDDFVFRDHNKKIVSTVFVSNQNNFNNNDFIQKIVTVPGNNYKVNFNLSDYRKITKIIFNPLKNQFCQFKINKIKIDNKILDLSKIKYESNGTLLDNSYIDFSKTSDPQIVLNINKKINKLKIVGNINFYNTENLYIDSTNQINNLSKQIEEVNKIVSSYQSENQNLSKQIEEVNKNISDIQTNLNIITSSKYYKIWRFYCKIKDTIK